MSKTRGGWTLQGQHHHPPQPPSCQPSGGFMARAAPSPSDPSCTEASRRHRAVIKLSKEPEHQGEETEGKAPLQPLETTKAALASSQVPLPSLMCPLTSHLRTHRQSLPPSSLFDFPPLNAGVKISSCEGSGTGNTRNTRN